ncbi:ATP synthase subunit C [Halovivax ruber XH-70]|uniref:ATP synthase subunit C n=1 Tax=Halovivax ruber (strain DSM 18193 / JCM 13892 / XH-70) TaxID=797302 RepID=L0IGQ0_HALRX|nr:ATP synthase subunit C [Halovivax ruber]AGB17162.1 ATP synthase subunit C [Halovivax ruber XH-70]
MIENVPDLLDTALQTTEAATNDADVEVASYMAAAAAAIGVGLAALASGYAERGIGAAAVGAIAEDRDMLAPGILLTVLPETLVIFSIVVIFLVQ